MMMGSGGGNRHKDALSILATFADPKRVEADIKRHADAEQGHARAASLHNKTKGEAEAALAQLASKEQELELRDHQLAEKAAQQAIFDRELLQRQLRLDARGQEIEAQQQAAARVIEEATQKQELANQAQAQGESRHVAASAREAAVAKREAALFQLTSAIKAG
jgi:hypothetical protein